MPDGRIASDSATCVASSAVHVFPRRAPALRLPNPRKPDRRHRPVTRNAGTAPAIAAASTLRPATQRTVANDGLKSIQNGRFPGSIVGMTILDNRPLSWRARRNPAIPAPAASTSTSTNSCITMRPRLAPNAVRTANSSRLVTVRAYTRIAMFAHGGIRRSAPSRKMTPASQRLR